LLLGAKTLNYLGKESGLTKDFYRIVEHKGKITEKEWSWAGELLTNAKLTINDGMVCLWILHKSVINFMIAEIPYIFILESD
jgi:hypothetical protein